jgi:hypothetical protein
LMQITTMARARRFMESPEGEMVTGERESANVLHDPGRAWQIG